MYSHILDHKPIDVAFSILGTRMAVLSDQHLVVYAINMTRRPTPKPEILWQSHFSPDHSARHVVFAGDDRVCVLTNTWDKNESYLWYYAQGALFFQQKILESEEASLLISSIDHSETFIQFRSGAVHRIVVNEVEAEVQFSTIFVHKFPSLAAEAQMISFKQEVSKKKSAG